MSGLGGQHTEFGCFSKQLQSLRMILYMFSQNPKRPPIQLNSPQWPDPSTCPTGSQDTKPAPSTGRAPAELRRHLVRCSCHSQPAPEPRTSCSNPREHSLPSFLSLSALGSPYFLSVAMVSHPKEEERPQAPLLSCQKLRLSPYIVCLWAPLASQTHENTFPRAGNSPAMGRGQAGLQAQQAAS